MLRLLVLVCLIWAGPSLAAPPDGLNATLRGLQDRAARVASLSCSFTQEKHLAMFAAPVTSTGRFLFTRPDKLRWEYFSPARDGFVLDGGSGARWTGESDARQTFSLRDDPAMRLVARQLLAWTTFDLPWLLREYDMKLESRTPTVLSLTPRQSGTAAVLESLIIEFSPESDTVRRLELHEPDGDFTRIIFANTTVNDPVDPALFR